MSRKFSKEIKEQAISLVEEHGVKSTQVVKELGIGKTTLEKWLRDYRTTESNGLTVNEKSELKQLREEVRILKVEKDLLKKATVYFAKYSE